MTALAAPLEWDVEPPPPAPGDWVWQAACGGIEVSELDFFGRDRAAWGASKQVCKGCPVRKQCLSYALDSQLVHGVWGGLDPLELRFALGLDAQGIAWAYPKTMTLRCPYCRGSLDSVHHSHMSATCRCAGCGFTWERADRQRKANGRKQLTAKQRRDARRVKRRYTAGIPLPGVAPVTCALSAQDRGHFERHPAVVTYSRNVKPSEAGLASIRLDGVPRSARIRVRVTRVEAGLGLCSFYYLPRDD